MSPSLTIIAPIGTSSFSLATNASFIASSIHFSCSNRTASPNSLASNIFHLVIFISFHLLCTAPIIFHTKKPSKPLHSSVYMIHSDLLTLLEIIQNTLERGQSRQKTCLLHDP